MSFSLTTLQIFDQYLTTYRAKDESVQKSALFSMHDKRELQKVYTDIQWNNRFAPIYLTAPTPKSIAYAVHLKESATALEQNIDSFSQKAAYSDNDTLASVEYIPDVATLDTPTDFELNVETFATPQVNTGAYLISDAPVTLPKGNYSFDILTNKLDYELQFNIDENETNLQLQNKLSNLINDLHLGISAKVVDNWRYSALEITSDSIGKPYKTKRHFTIEDENTTYEKGVVDYLGLNSSIKEATNAVYSINGKVNISYSNSFNVHGAYHITLHPENDGKEDAHIRLTSTPDPLSNHLQSFVDGYNNFLTTIINDEEDEDTTKILSNDLNKFLKDNKKVLTPYGITINKDSTLTYNKTDETQTQSANNTVSIKNFGQNILRKLNAISLDPMEYVDRRICMYQNPNAPYPNPYMTSIYSGMLLNTYI